MNNNNKTEWVEVDVMFEVTNVYKERVRMTQAEYDIMGDLDTDSLAENLISFVDLHNPYDHYTQGCSRFKKVDKE